MLSAIRLRPEVVDLDLLNSQFIGAIPEGQTAHVSLWSQSWIRRQPQESSFAHPLGVSIQCNVVVIIEYGCFSRCRPTSTHLARERSALQPLFNRLHGVDGLALRQFYPRNRHRSAIWAEGIHEYGKRKTAQRPRRRVANSTFVRWLHAKPAA